MPASPTMSASDTESSRYSRKHSIRSDRTSRRSVRMLHVDTESSAGLLGSPQMDRRRSSRISRKSTLGSMTPTSIASLDSWRPLSPAVALSRDVGGAVSLVDTPPTRPASHSISERLYSWISVVVQSTAFSALMFTLTIYVLFGDDVRLWLFVRTADKVFDVFTGCCLVLFTFEIIALSVVVDDYVFSFFFILDIIATLSLILDLTMIWEILTAMEGGSFDLANQSEYARAGRSSRVGTRVARVVRVVKIVRMVRVVKLFSWTKAKVTQDSALGKAEPGVDTDAATGVIGSTEKSKYPYTRKSDDSINEADEEGRKNDKNESRVGKKLSERTTLWVIVLVLAMLVLVPVLNVGHEEEMMQTSAQYGAQVIYQALVRSSQAPDDAQLRIEYEMQVLMYVYYHNYQLAGCNLPETCEDQVNCVAEFTSKLIYVGFLVDSSVRGNISEDIGRPVQGLSVLDGYDCSHPHWQHNVFLIGGLPEELRRRLAKPWTKECEESTSSTSAVYGVSLLLDELCPLRLGGRLRSSEVVVYAPEHEMDSGTSSSGKLLLIFSIHALTAAQACMSIVRTIFIIFTLVIGALFFSRDLDRLVLEPIERMIQTVEEIRKDPLKAIKLGDGLFMEQEREKRSSTCMEAFLFFVSRVEIARGADRVSRRAINVSSRRRRHEAQKASMIRKQSKRGAAEKKLSLETRVLENTIIKLGSLLAIGFGEAGTEIIAENLDEKNETVNAIIPGRRVEAIYGFCNIQNFHFTTEVLQQKTMVFVNQVAAIVHSIVDEHLGAANKNIGEAFLLVWRVGLYDEELRPKVADLSVLSFVQVLAATHRDPKVAVYREHPALLAKCSDYRMHLHFGLHLGWSIEGAIGSQFKIDASYLSSHVNMAVQLESMTKLYGVMLLMSEDIVRVGSKEVAFYYRAIDNLTLCGAANPLRIFTVDLNVHALQLDSVSRRIRRSGDMQTSQQRLSDRRNREEKKNEKLQLRYRVDEQFAHDRQIKIMRSSFTLDFFQEFEKGYLNYESGEWDVARDAFENTATMLKELPDGPSKALLEFMNTHDFVAPADWPGFRGATSPPEITYCTRPRNRRRTKMNLQPFNAEVPFTGREVPSPKHTPSATTISTSRRTSTCASTAVPTNGLASRRSSFGGASSFSIDSSTDR
eukprot:TRINITY_DN61109_c0_g1_i1.p1 TRINITY_DN61109_c0_g1~~TRINITY_DN61109_c0_g1_i1.p1  ORF type:complete len:1150 (+),score=181.25 TRINITY_DN61109_c0_g1_i1:253-3702(+)